MLSLHGCRKGLVAVADRRQHRRTRRDLHHQSPAVDMSTQTWPGGGRVFGAIVLCVPLHHVGVWSALQQDSSAHETATQSKRKAYASRCACILCPSLPKRHDPSLKHEPTIIFFPLPTSYGGFGMPAHCRLRFFYQVTNTSGTRANRMRARLYEHTHPPTPSILSSDSAFPHDRCLRLEGWEKQLGTDGVADKS